MNNQTQQVQNCINNTPVCTIFDKRNQFIGNLRKGDRANIINLRRNFDVNNNNDMQYNNTITTQDNDQNSNMSWPVMFSYESNSTSSIDGSYSDSTLQELDSSNRRQRKFTDYDIESE